MEKITMNEGNSVINYLFSTNTNYGVASLVALMTSALSGWIGFKLAFAQIALTFSGVFAGAHASGSNTYGLVGAGLIVVSFLVLVWAIALAGAGFAVKRGILFSLLTILLVISPIFYFLFQFSMALHEAGPSLLFK